MSHDDQLKDPLYRNWVKAGLGIKYLHEGIVTYIDTQVKTLQNDFLTDIRNNLGNPSATCSSCKLENVLPCPTPGICTVRSGKQCRFHGSQRYTPCPNRICDTIYEKIKTMHRDERPSWKNTDPTKWCTDHWEIGKCFIAETGYYDKQSAVDTDYTGLLSVIVNCLYMTKKFDVYLDPPNDIVYKNRKARNEIFHSTSMKLTDAERDRYIDDMVLFLKDKKLTTDLNVQSAITKLHQLKVQTLAISVKEEYEIRLDALNQIETLRQEAITTMRDKQEESTKAVASDAQKALDTIEEKKDETEKTHDAHTKDITEMFNKLTEHGEKIEQTLDAKVASTKQVLDTCQGDVNSISEDIQELKEHNLNKSDDLHMYMQNKRDNDDVSVCRNNQQMHDVQFCKRIFKVSGNNLLTEKRRWKSTSDLTSNSWSLWTEINKPNQTIVSLEDMTLEQICLMFDLFSEEVNTKCQSIVDYLKTIKGIKRVLPSYKASNKDSIVFIVLIEAEMDRRALLLPYPYNVLNLKLKSVKSTNDENNNITSSDIYEKADLSDEDMIKLNNVFSREAPGLLENHSNLCAIVISPVKSKQNGTNVIEVACFVMYVYAKGLIPRYEDKFPEVLDGIPTDVREGTFSVMLPIELRSSIRNF